jgi:hypothetical protein
MLPVLKLIGTKAVSIHSVNIRRQWSVENYETQEITNARVLVFIEAKAHPLVQLFRFHREEFIFTLWELVKI